MAIEFVGGYLTNSLALMSDAVHMLTDAAALGLSFGAFYMSQKPASLKRTFGFHRFEILAAFANGLLLIGLSVVIIYQSLFRLQHPEDIKALQTMAIATVGLIFNIYSAFILLKADHSDLNVRGAFFHVMGDLLGSVGAIVAGAMIYWFGLRQADAVVSIVISVIIIVSAWKLVADTVHVMLENAPAHMDVDEIQQEMLKVPEVDALHDLHVWCITSNLVSLSAHVVSRTLDTQALLIRLRNCLQHKFEITHVTIQIETESLQEFEPSV